MYLDSTNMVVVDSTNWIPVYQTRTNGENGEISPGYPWLIAFTRTSERITYCKTTDFSPVEGVLYDFNLMQGDSAWIVTWTNAAVDSALYVVDSVKYKDCLHGDSLKHMYVRALANPTSMFHSHRTVWIEGIGDIYHPYLPSTCLSGTCELEFDVFKFYYGNQWVNVNDLLCEDIISSVQEPPPPDVQIFPNPVSRNRRLRIETAGELLTAGYVYELATGREVYRAKFTPSPFWELSPERLVSGVYVVRVRTLRGAEALRRVVVRQ